ncbi:hypothetical protein OG948_12695 [Embleya sp. NBC_00888]|uniref:hypothetical protein n=1 Tax=Embleya sp. NBC_00888 TaxID=2975960 RepID=UPI003864A6C3|nr:hypothetical protein OG948_12695 [Embleya sp. NBC_00888]
MRPGATKRIAISGTVVAFLIVAGLGNQWVFKESWGESSDSGKWYMVLLRIIGHPLWIADKGELGDEFRVSFTTKDVTAGYVGIAVLFVVVAAVLALGARGLGERAGGFMAFVLGWFSLVLGGALHSLTVFTIVHDEAGRGRGISGFQDAMTTIQAGAYFGLLTGWLVGLAAAAGYVAARGAANPTGYPQPPMTVYGQPAGYGPPAAPGNLAFGLPPQSPYDAPTTIRPAGPPPTAPPRPTGAPDTPPGGYRP